MRKSRFSERQIVSIPNEAEAGLIDYEWDAQGRLIQRGARELERGSSLDLTP